jgi:integrase
MVRKEIMVPWRGRRLSGITKADIHVLIDAITDRPAPVLAGKVFKTFRRLCNWALDRGLIDVSPCAGIKRKSAERSRDRVLDDDELRAVWLACEAIGWPFGQLIQFLILTGARLSEVALLRWSEIDLVTKVWVLPKERSKNKIAHQIPLSRRALEILEKSPRIAGDQDFVFTTNGKTAVSGFSAAKRRLDAKMPQGTPGWTFHDARRSFASGCARLGIAVHVVEAALNHRSGTIKGVAAVYNRYSYDTEKRKALEIWGRYVETLVSCETGNIIELAARVNG